MTWLILRDKASESSRCVFIKPKLQLVLVRSDAPNDLLEYVWVDSDRFGPARNHMISPSYAGRKSELPSRIGIYVLDCELPIPN